jgi:hypothetical protein
MGVFRHEAADATVGIPGGHSKHLGPKKKRKGPKPRAYAVFYGLVHGTFVDWFGSFPSNNDNTEYSPSHRFDVIPLVMGVDDAIYQGYPSLGAAEAAFAYAESRQWTGIIDPLVPRVRPSSLPVPHGPDTVLSPLHNGVWYIVYKGLTPGIYQSRYVRTS